MVGTPPDQSVQPQDEHSGLVRRQWTRTSRTGRKLTDRTLEGEHVRAEFITAAGELQDVEGVVTRSAAGNLVVESLRDGMRLQTAVPRDAIVTVSWSRQWHDLDTAEPAPQRPGSRGRV